MSPKTPERGDSQEITDEHTPPPVLVPMEPHEQVKLRRHRASQHPDVPQVLRQTIEDLWHEIAKYRDVARDNQDAVQRLWGLRDLHNQVLQMAAELAHLKGRPQEHDARLAALILAVSQLEKALVDIHGTSGTNGKLGELRRNFDDLEEHVKTALAAHETDLKSLNAFRWKVLGMATAGSVVGGLLVTILSKLL